MPKLLVTYGGQEGNVPTSMTTSTQRRGKDEDTIEHANDKCCVVTLLINLVGQKGILE